jgi:hypothetical protein
LKNDIIIVIYNYLILYIEYEEIIAGWNDQNESIWPRDGIWYDESIRDILIVKVTKNLLSYQNEKYFYFHNTLWDTEYHINEVNQDLLH